MRPFIRHTAVAAPLIRDNIDTDAIIPSREMRSVSREGLADGLFAGWRYREIGSRDPDPGFVLNQARYHGAQILVGGANFGCGSSREHAVWALAEYGVRAVVAPSFNPIFRGNCINNGVVPVALEAERVAALGRFLNKADDPVLTVDLEQCLVRAGDDEFPFEIDPQSRHALLAGLDPIGQTMQLAARIRAFRAADMVRRPWIYAPVARSEGPPPHR